MLYRKRVSLNRIHQSLQAPQFYQNGWSIRTRKVGNYVLKEMSSWILEICCRIWHSLMWGGPTILGVTIRTCCWRNLFEVYHSIVKFRCAAKEFLFWTSCSSHGIYMMFLVAAHISDPQWALAWSFGCSIYLVWVTFSFSMCLFSLYVEPCSSLCSGSLWALNLFIYQKNNNKIFH